MFKYLLKNSADDINWIGIMVLLTFVTIFTVVIIQVFVKRKEEVDYQSGLPFGDGGELDRS